MYRIAALISLKEGIESEDEDRLVEAVMAHEIYFEESGGKAKILLDGDDVSADIRTPELTRKVGPVCELPKIRALMGDLQRKMGLKGGVVLEGRDIGTVIFPEAEIKIFLNASPRVRAQRRWREMVEKGFDADLENVLNDINERDRRDSLRELAPLKKADDAVEIDTSDMTIEQVVMRAAAEVEKFRREN